MWVSYLKIALIIGDVVSENLYVVVGLGITGVSCVKYLLQQGISVAVTDSRASPPALAEFRKQYPDVPVTTGQLDESLLAKASKIVISPGVSSHESAILKQHDRGVPVVGDIELFAEVVASPVIAITGTNAKSTVTTLVGEMATHANVKVQVGGNLGKPALALLTTPQAELFVLELSSFQLETTYSLKPSVATLLNVTPDHMDRYADLPSYCAAKQRIYLGCHTAVCNRDDAVTDCLNDSIQRKLYFTLKEPNENEFGLLTKQHDLFLAFERTPLISVNELPILGRHYQANALASLALGYAYGLPMSSMLDTLRTFRGLPHRCQLVRERNDVRWYNDSKGTNVGAALAAIEGLGAVIEGKLILIAGGIGKNADFSPLVPAIKQYVKTVLLIGEAAPILEKTIGKNARVYFANNMQEAIRMADQESAPGDSILLSPACASFDMFNHFEHRGTVFTELVQGLT